MRFVQDKKLLPAALAAVKASWAESAGRQLATLESRKVVLATAAA